METALRFDTHVLPGHRIEVSAPELPEGAHVQLIVSDISVEPYRQYPSAIEAEYNLLIDKKLDRALSEEEACRLQDLRSVIAEIDRLTLPNDIRIERLNHIEAELNQLEIEIDALPNA